MAVSRALYQLRAIIFPIILDFAGPKPHFHRHLPLAIARCALFLSVEALYFE
jgi:hypothetical protein